jgi:hypothetical protein
MIDFGADPEKYHGPTVGGHIHKGPPTWRTPYRWLRYQASRHYRALRDAVLIDMRKMWKHYLFILVLVLLVDKLSKWAGTLSINIW